MGMNRLRERSGFMWGGSMDIIATLWYAAVSGRV